MQQLLISWVCDYCDAMAKRSQMLPRGGHVPDQKSETEQPQFNGPDSAHAWLLQGDVVVVAKCGCPKQSDLGIRFRFTQGQLWRALPSRGWAPAVGNPDRMFAPGSGWRDHGWNRE